VATQRTHVITVPLWIFWDVRHAEHKRCTTTVWLYQRHMLEGDAGSAACDNRAEACEHTPYDSRVHGSCLRQSYTERCDADAAGTITPESVARLPM
jgi:hypothetical protein